MTDIPEDRIAEPHVAHARRLAEDARIRTVTFHAADFAAANEAGLQAFDAVFDLMLRREHDDRHIRLGTN